MKKVLCIAFLVFLLSINIGLSQEIPTLKKYVNDLANVLPAPDESRIDTLCSEIEKNWTIEIAVLTVQSTEPMSIEEYALKTFEKNGIGKKDKDNGLLIVVAIQDRKWRFEVGYGLEPIINDAKAGRIGRTYLTPYFKEEKYGEGLYYAVDAVNKVIQAGGDISIISEQGISEEMAINNIILFLIVFFFVLLPLILFIVRNVIVERCPKCGAKMKCHYKDDYVICECPKCGKKVKKKRERHFWFFVGGFGGGGGGGGGGFGGGASGGGGSSGGW